MIRSFLLAILIISLNTQSLFAYDEVTEKFRSINKNSSPLENCSTCDGAESTTGTIYSPHNKKNIELTVLSEDRLKDVFKKIQDDEDNSFAYPYEGCFARAHKMAMVMDDLGIVSGKAFVEGQMHFKTKEAEFTWTYHVASLVLVKKGKKLVPMIIDPAIFKRPVTHDEWKAFLLKDPKSKKSSEYFTKRFNYDPETRHADLKEYNEDEIDNMNSTNRQNNRNAEMMKLADKIDTQGHLK